MTTLNLTPVLDALGGTTTTPAVFKAEARRAGRRATRVNGAEVTFATELIAVWDGAAWNTPPTLYSLPVDCYWNVKVQASGNRLEVNGILPDGRDSIDFADLIAITPETGQVDTSTVKQFQATQQYVSNQVTEVAATAATIFDTVATVQAQIGTAAQVATEAATILANAQTVQAEISDDVAAVAAAATQTATDRIVVTAARATVEAVAATLPIPRHHLTARVGTSDGSSTAFTNTATFTTVPLNTVDNDTAAGFDSSTGIYLIPETGFWQIQAAVRPVDGQTIRQIGVGVGVDNIDSATFAWLQTSTALRSTLLYSRIGYFTGGDQVRLFTYADVSGTTNFNTAALSLAYLGD